jgi:predicted alpha/beta-hydrolase family hydrolase
MARNDAGATRVTIMVPEIGPVSGLALVPARAHTLFVLAHGAGAGMTHPWLEAVAAQLVDRGIATLRFQFPFMERGSRRPDPPAIAQATGGSPWRRRRAWLQACPSSPAGARSGAA